MSKSKSDIVEEVVLQNKEKSNGEIADILLKDYPTEFTTWKRKSIRDEVRKSKNRIKNGILRTESNGEPLTETYDFKDGGNSAVFSKKVRGEEIKSLEGLIKACNIDTKIWKVDRWICNKWEVASKWREQDLEWVVKKDAEGNNQQLMEGFAERRNEFIKKELWQVKAWLSRNVEQIVTSNLKQELLDEIKNYSIKYPKIEYPNIIGYKQLLQINIFDLHFGKHSWEEETGENFDIHIATAEYLDCMKRLLLQAKPYSISRILVPIGNDFFNVDNRLNMTTNGTLQNEDTRWQKTFSRGRQMLIQAIDMLSQIAPVDVIVVPGNHDMERSFYLGEALEGWYHNNPNVNINNSPKLRKYYRYGNTLLGFTHGRDEKIVDLPIIMASEAPELWAVTKYREWHLGHVHHKKEMKWISTQEFKGVTVRFMRSLTPNDAWHYQKGYVGQIRSGEGFVWDEKTGLVSQFSANL